MDIFELLKAPLKDSDWPKKIILMGLIGLIPIVGQLNLMGWLVATYELRAGGEDEDLPPVGFGHLGRGFQLFLAFLPVMGVMIGLNVVVAILGKIAGFLGVLGGVGVTFVGVAVWVATPAIVFLHVVRGVKWASADVRAVRDVVMNDRVAYFTVLVVYLAAELAGGFVSLLSCGICAIVAIPWITAVSGGALAAFAKETKA